MVCGLWVCCCCCGCGGDGGGGWLWLVAVGCCVFFLSFLLSFFLMSNFLFIMQNVC